MSKNLLKETIDDMKHKGKKPDDVLWVGDLTRYFTWDEFAEIADKVYYEGYGMADVFEGLMVVGKDWWLERNEYDGSEWWEFKTLPTQPEKRFAPSSVFSEDYKDYNVYVSGTDTLAHVERAEKENGNN